MSLNIVRTVAPAIEPVTLVQVKTQLRLDTTDLTQDALLGIYVSAAREYVELQTGRALITQTFVLRRDSFPCVWSQSFGLPWAPFYGSAGAYGIFGGIGTLCSTRTDLLLPGGMIQKVTGVQYVDTTSTLQTLDPAAYVLDPGPSVARIAPVFGRWWPATALQAGAVQVTFTAGYGDAAAAVPASLQLAILLLVGHWYENREATQAALAGNGPMPLPLGVDALLAPFVVPAFTLE